MEGMTQNEILMGNAAFANKLNVIHHAYVDITGDLVAGALLGQILYWFSPDKNGKPRARIQKHGHLWIAKGRGDWWEEIRISAKQYDRAAKILKDLGFIEVRTMKFYGNPTTHIRIKPAQLNQAIDNWKREQVFARIEMEQVQQVQNLVAVGFSPLGNNEMPQTGNPYLPNGEIQHIPNGNNDFNQTGNSLTEITAENKKENTADNTHTLKADACEPLLFNEIWSHYPKKQGRSKANRAYLQAINSGVNPLAILVETVVFKHYIYSQLERNEIEWRYVPTGGAWFHERRWEDETPSISSTLDYDAGLDYNRAILRLRRIAREADNAETLEEMQAALKEIQRGILEMPY